MTATAMINGQVILSGDKINVEPILVFRGCEPEERRQRHLLGAVLVREAWKTVSR
jgi:hypothetical protein